MKISENGRNFREYEFEHSVKSTSKFAKIFNENERISFVHFSEFCSWKILIETLDLKLFIELDLQIDIRITVDLP